MSEKDPAATEPEELPAEPFAVSGAPAGDVSDVSEDSHAEPLSDDAAESPEAGRAQPDDGLTPRQRRELRLQRKRERRIWTGLIAGAFVVLALFFLAFWPVMAGRLDAANKLDQAHALLDQAKPTVNDIDKVVALQLSPRATAGVPDTAPQVLVARRELKQGLALIDEAMPHLTDDEQKRASLIRTATKARLDMIDRAPGILVSSVKAVTAKSLVDQAWKATQSSTAAETTAVSGYQSAKALAVAGAGASLLRVKGQLGDARALYSQAVLAFPGAGFERYVTYIDIRSQGVKLLSQATSKWLKGDLTGASADFSAYQRTAAKASAAVAKLPSAPSAPGKAFRKMEGPAIEGYRKAKQQALDADKALCGL